MTMQKRRSHKKSRNGCQNCKKWHTKCDEQGPPCNNCRLRKANCVYNRPKTEASDNGGTLTIRLRHGTVTRYSGSVERPRGDIGGICAAYGGPSGLLELELMHQWSTSTYKSFCCIPEDAEYLQVVLPQSALNHDFMLNCLFAISSLHIARTGGGVNSEKYVNAGLEYYNRGSSSFRTHLSNMNSENAHVLYMFSAITIGTYLSIPRRSSALDSLKVAFDLVNGSTRVGMMGMPWILNSRFPLRLFISRIGASKDFIDPEVRAALARLHTLNDQRHKATSKPVDGGDGDLIVIQDYELYHMAIQHLETCFAEESRGLLKGFGTAYPGMLSKHFTVLIGRSDPFTLLIVMHWAVLLSMTDSRFWWTASIPKVVAAEISDFLTTSHPDLALEWADAISWALGRLSSTSQLPGRSPGQLPETPYRQTLEGDVWEIA